MDHQSLVAIASVGTIAAFFFIGFTFIGGLRQAVAAVALSLGILTAIIGTLTFWDWVLS